MLANPLLSHAKNEYHYPDSDDNENTQEKVTKSSEARDSCSST